MGTKGSAQESHTFQRSRHRLLDCGQGQKFVRTGLWSQHPVFTFRESFQLPATRLLDNMLRSLLAHVLVALQRESERCRGTCERTVQACSMLIILLEEDYLLNSVFPTSCELFPSFVIKKKKTVSQDALNQFPRIGPKHLPTC